LPVPIADFKELSGERQYNLVLASWGTKPPFEKGCLNWYIPSSITREAAFSFFFKKPKSLSAKLLLESQFL
jgi:hypothetical protein